MYALSPGTRALSKNLNGQHVIQHCLARFSDEDNRVMILFFLVIFVSCCNFRLLISISASVSFSWNYFFLLLCACLVVFVVLVTVLHSLSKQVFKSCG